MSSHVTPVQFPLTAIFDIQPPVEENYQKLAAALEAQGPPTITNNILHFIRIVFLSNNTQLGVITTFDGEWQTYIQDFVDSSADFFNALLPFIAPPDVVKQIVPVQKNAVAFGNFVLTKNNPPSDNGQLLMPASWFSAYPTMTVVDILNCQEQNNKNT
ncbi:MAG TPA: hypothetical protein VF528_20790 [Pyrinomonadaceae bacterium]|jgi:hypothetical protein